MPKRPKITSGSDNISERELALAKNHIRIVRELGSEYDLLVDVHQTDPDGRGREQFTVHWWGPYIVDVFRRVERTRGHGANRELLRGQVFFDVLATHVKRWERDGKRFKIVR